MGPRARCRGLPHTVKLTKHWAATLDDYVIDLAWSPDGDGLAAASTTGPVSLFARADGARRHELPGLHVADYGYAVAGGGPSSGQACH